MSNPNPRKRLSMSADMLPNQPVQAQDLRAGDSQPPVIPNPPVEAEPVAMAEPIVLYYTGDGMHQVPGLPGRDLTQADIDTSPYKGDPAQILKFTPAVFSEQPKATDSGPAFEVFQPAPTSLREE